MRKHHREITSRPEQDAILRARCVAQLAMVDGALPYLLPISYGYDGTALYLHCAPEGKKLDVLRQNSAVALNILGPVVLSSPGEAARACAMTAYYESVTVFGRAILIQDAEERMHGLAAIARQHDAGHLPLSDMPERLVVIRVDITSISAKRHPAPAPPENDAARRPERHA